MVRLAGSLFNDAGAALASASVYFFLASANADESTGTTCIQNTTTNSAGVWAKTDITTGTYDVRIQSGSSVRWRRYEDELQVARVNIGDNASGVSGVLALGNDSDIVMLNSAALSADATLSGVIESGGGVDHPGVTANSLIISNITDNGDIMFAVSDGGNSKGLLKLCGTNGRVIVHGGDLLMSGTQKIYFNDIGGEYMSSDGSTLTITGATALTPTIGATAWGNANHTHAGGTTGGTVTASSATAATTVTVTDNEDTDEENLVTFVAGAATSTGTQALEMDGHLAYNPSTGTLTSTAFAGNITGNLTGALQTASQGTITTVGALAGGSIACGFGAIDNGTSNVTSGGTWSVDVDATGTDGTGLTAAGTLRFGASQDLAIYHGGSHNYITGITGDIVITTDGGSGGGIILDAEDDTVEIKYSGTVGASFGTGGLNLASGDVFSINCTQVLSGSALASAVKLNNANWCGTDLAVANGGTNLSVYAVGDILYASGTTTLAKLTKGSEDEVLTMGGSCAPTWAAAGGGAVSAINNATANELVTIGATTTELCAEANLTFDGTTLTHQTTGATVSIFSRYSADATAPDLRLLKSRGTSLGAANAIQSGDKLGRISWYGADGDSLESGAYIEVLSGATWSDSNRQTYMDTYITPSGGSNTNTLTTRLTSDGQLRLKDGSVSAPALSFLCDTDTGFYRPASNQIGYAVGGNERGRFMDQGLFLGDNCSGSNFLLLVNQAGYDTNILELKSSDVAHGLTGIAETDTFGSFSKTGGVTGGLKIKGLSDAAGNIGLFIDSHIPGTMSDGKSTTANGYMSFRSYLNESSAPGTDQNLVAIRAACTTRFIFDTEGTFHADVGSTTYDDHCDVELMRGLLGQTVDGYKESYQDRFGKDLMYNLCFYEENKLIGKDSIHWEERECGRMQQRAMINFTGLTMLHHSTIIQLADRVDARLTALENQIALQGGK